VIKLCLKFVPADQEVVVVLNGLERWEREWAQRHYHIKGFIFFPMILTHEQVIDYLLDWMKQPFGLLDDDCFVFCSEYFERIKEFPKNAIISSWYGYKNEKLELVFPETFFMFINTPFIKRIRKQFRINSRLIYWDQLPVEAQNKMIKIGISRENLPESNKSYFDTLRALMALGLAENYQFYFPEGYSTNYLTKQEDNIFHVGSVAKVPLRGVCVNNKYNARGSYFWYRALERMDDRDIQDKYYKKYGYLLAEYVLEQFPNARDILGNDFFVAVERIINS
jgi:hypothetical protein